MRFSRILLICVLSIFCFSCLSPSEATVKSEFISKNPNAEIINTELIFEQDSAAVYLVKYKEKNSQEISTSDFALKRENLSWKWCDDRTERKCQ
jgi:hypothetical protein